MIFWYVCKDCINKESSSDEISSDDYNNICNKIKWKIKHPALQHPTIICPHCNSNNTTKIMSISTSYIRGYGYVDKDGARNDMDLHLMTTDKDPYHSSRKPGEKNEVITKLRRRKRFDSKRKDVHMS